MGSITIVVPSADEWYFRELLAGARTQIEAAGHSTAVRVIRLSSTSSAEATSVVGQDFESPDCLGAIASGFKYRPDQSEKALAWKRPLVVTGNSALGFPNVSIDEMGAAMTITHHLVDLGHTRIAHLTGGLDPAASFLFALRRAKGYRTAMEGAGLQPNVVETDFDPDRARATARTVLESSLRPTALFATTDDIAFAAIAAARDLGLRVGDDVSIAGINDDPRAADEDLTTIRQRPAEIGATAADLLLDSIVNGSSAKRSRLHPTSFVQRGSTQRLRS